MSVDEEYLQKVMRTFSHDISSSLRAAIGFPKLISEQYSEQLDDRVLGWLELMRREGERAQEQLKEFSRYARLYGIDESKRHCSLQQLCLQVIGECQQDYPGSLFEVEALPVVLGYEKLWLTYFRELLSNSSRYAGDGVICRIYTQDSGGSCDVIIEDNGPGLNARNLDAAQQPFKTLQEQPQGVGIGLSVVKRIVEIHDGNLEIESLADGIQGLRITAHIPVIDA
jgi:signal transduction histidine kinase